jgi:hypothetical protein
MVDTRRLRLQQIEHYLAHEAAHLLLRHMHERVLLTNHLKFDEPLCYAVTWAGLLWLTMVLLAIVWGWCAVVGAAAGCSMLGVLRY